MDPSVACRMRILILRLFIRTQDMDLSTAKISGLGKSDVFKK
jgi:hypothetical protein